jgi:hypothetical protein
MFNRHKTALCSAKDVQHNFSGNMDTTNVDYYTTNISCNPSNLEICCNMLGFHGGLGSYYGVPGYNTV